MKKMFYLGFIALASLTTLWGCGETVPETEDTEGTGSTDPDASDVDGGSDGDTDTDTDGDTDTDTDGDSDSDADGDADDACDEVGEGSGTFTDQYMSTTISVADSDKSYILQTNWWGAFVDQTVSYDGISFTVGNPSGVSSEQGQNPDWPIGFPSLLIGRYAGNQSAESNLPIAITDIESVPTSFHTNASDIGIDDNNAAYDVWLTASGDPLPDTQYSPGSGGAFLMVWLYKPTNRQPRGTNAHPDQTVSGVSGTWDVWVDSGGTPCVSYVSTEPIDGLDFDLNDFIRDSVENGYGNISEDMYLNIIFAGFEIWGDSDGLSVEAFCAEVN